MTLHHYSEDASTNAKPRTCRDCNNLTRSAREILCTGCGQVAHELRVRMQRERARARYFRMQQPKASDHQS